MMLASDLSDALSFRGSYGGTSLPPLDPERRLRCDIPRRVRHQRVPTCRPPARCASHHCRTDRAIRGQYRLGRPEMRGSDLTLRDTRGGRPASAGRRGRSSVVLQDAPLVVLDGVRLTDFRALDGIPAATILTIAIYNGIEGTTYYGTNAVSGVIVIRTKDGAEP